jgi:hypothetical protein
MSVDPFIHGSGSQGINPYSYLLNNPLAGTDPSGYRPSGLTCPVGNGMECTDFRKDKPKKKERDGRNGKGGGWVTTYARPDWSNGYICSANSKSNETDSTKIGSFSSSSKNNSSSFAFVDWRAYVNDEVSRAPIDYTIAEQISLPESERFSNFNAILGMWTKINTHINEGNIKFAAALVSGRFGKLFTSQQARGLLRTQVISPTYRQLQGLNKGFEAHHILPQYLGKMLGYTKKQMMDHPATSIPKFKHTAVYSGASKDTAT